MITEKIFGKTQDGQEVTLYSLTNKNGMHADVMNYGAIMVNLFAPDRQGRLADVTLGYDSLKKYFTSSTSSETSSIIGPSIIHGPHHSAQKSTSTLPL